MILILDEASTVSESEDALVWNEERMQTNIDNWNVIPNAHMLEQLSNEHISQDTSKAEVQLRLILLLFNFVIHFMDYITDIFFIADICYNYYLKQVV